MDEGNSILDGVDKIIDEALELGRIGKGPQYKYKEHCQKLRPSHNPDIKTLIERIHQQVESNWKKHGQQDRSQENWRLETLRKPDPDASVEIKLERTIAKHLGWANQVPTSSGLAGPRADQRRCIDLVCKCGNGVYDFIELKVESDTPLFAAMEILQYGILYIFSRENKLMQRTAGGRLLSKATDIHLKVLAPAEYYAEYKSLAWLEDAINRGLHTFLEQSGFDFKMDFEFQQFPITDAIEGRIAVYK